MSVARVTLDLMLTSKTPFLEALLLNAMVSARLLELRSTSFAALQSRTIQPKDDRLAILQEQVDRIHTVFSWLGVYL